MGVLRLGFLALLLGHLGAEHDVTEEPLRGLLVVLGRRTQLVHREGHDIRRARQVHPLDVQLLHRGAVHHDHRELGEGVDPHARERVAGDVEDRLLVDLGSGLVVDVDRHGALLLLPVVAAAAPLAAAVLLALAVVVLLVRVDDTADELVPDDILGGEPGEVHVVDASRISWT